MHKLLVFIPNWINLIIIYLDVALFLRHRRIIFGVWKRKDIVRKALLGFVFQWHPSKFQDLSKIMELWAKWVMEIQRERDIPSNESFLNGQGWATIMPRSESRSFSHFSHTGSIIPKHFGSILLFLSELKHRSSWDSNRSPSNDFFWKSSSTFSV